MQAIIILLLTTNSGLHVLHYAILVLICLESAVNDAFLRHQTLLALVASRFICLIFRMEFLLLSSS